MLTTSVQTSFTTLPTPQELARLAEYLIATRDNLAEIVSGLSGPQFDFKPEPGRWSIAEILEHLALIEDRIQATIARLPEAPPAELDRIDSDIDEIILREVPRRSTRAPAPPLVSPSNRWSPAESLSRFLAARNRALDLLVSVPCLRGRVLPHPVLGPCDGYQWLLAVAAHTQRHASQVLELKASAGFP